MNYLSKKQLNYNPTISTLEQYNLVRLIENFKQQITGVVRERNKKPEFEPEEPTGEEISSEDLNTLINLLSDIEARKKPITKIAYQKALNILQQDIRHLPTLKNILKSKGIVKNASAPIEQILSANTSNHINSLVSYTRGENQISASDLASANTPAPVSTLFPDLHPELVKNLFDTTVPAGGGKQTGKGELALILLLKGAKRPTEGDVVVPEGVIEVKQGESFSKGEDKTSAGRLIGAHDIYGDGKKAFKTNFKNIFTRGGSETVNVFETTHWYNLNEKNLNLLTKMLTKVMEATPGQNIRSEVVSAYQASIREYLRDLDGSLVDAAVEEGFDPSGLPIKEKLVENIFKLSFRYYHSTENFIFFAVYRDGELFFKTAEDAYKSIGTTGGLTYADGPNFQDTRASAFKITF